jgi:AraC-like DNA-binding protein
MPLSPSIRRSFVVPQAALRPFVERIWSWESEEVVPLPFLLPGTGSELMLHFKQPFVAIDQAGTRYFPASAHLFCLRTFSCRLVPQGPVGFVSVRFRSSAIRHFGRLGMADLIDRFPAAAEHLGPGIDEVPARLGTLNGFEERAAYVERLLLGMLKKKSPQLATSDAAVNAIYYGAADATVAAIAEDMGYSNRQLERLVGEAAGMTPKRFQRLARLNHTMRQLLLSENTQYLDTALSHGYYDQAHFIHEFGSFTGKTPGDVLTDQSFMSHFYNHRLPR